MEENIFFCILGYGRQGQEPDYDDAYYDKEYRGVSRFFILLHLSQSIELVWVNSLQLSIFRDHIGFLNIFKKNFIRLCRVNHPQVIMDVDASAELQHLI